MRRTAPRRTAAKLWLVVFMLAAAFGTGAYTLSQQQKPAAEAAKKPKVRLVQSVDDASKLALQDVQELLKDPASAAGIQYVRYLWNQRGTMAAVRYISFVLAHINRADVFVPPTPIAGGHLVRVNLVLYARNRQDLDELVDTWEELAFGGEFSLLVTHDTIQLLGEEGRKRLPKRTERIPQPDRIEENFEFTCPANGEFRPPDDSGRIIRKTLAGEALVPGNKYRCDLKFHVLPKLVEVEADVDVLRLNPDTIDPRVQVELQSLLHSQAPMTYYAYAAQRLLSQVQGVNAAGKDDGQQSVFRTLFGGLYYRARGIKRAKDVLGKDTRATDQDLFYFNLGIGSIEKDRVVENFKRLFDRVHGDGRKLMRSNVTGKWRIVLRLHSNSGGDSCSLVFNTLDIIREDVDILQRPNYSLIENNVRAQEVIAFTVNGFPEFALFNGAGALVDEVPSQNVALDTTIPDYVGIKPLEPAVSCLRCHGFDGFDGWKPLADNLKQWLGGSWERRGNRLWPPVPGGRADIFGDLSQKGKEFDGETYQRLAGLYAGNFMYNLDDARRDQARATLAATGPWDADLNSVHKTAVLYLKQDWEQYNYRTIDAQEALYRCGFEVDKENAVEVLNKLLPPDPRNPAIVNGQLFFQEDWRALALKSGDSIYRDDWVLFQSFFAERVRKRWNELKGNVE